MVEQQARSLQLSEPMTPDGGILRNRDIRPSDHRYTPKRGLVRRIRAQQAYADISDLAERHNLDPQTRTVLTEELIKAGAPPVLPATTEKALTGLLQFEPLNTDALKPFLLLSMDRGHRNLAALLIRRVMQNAGRSVKILVDTGYDSHSRATCDYGKQDERDFIPYEGAAHCVDILRKTDLACLSLIGSGFRTPLDSVATARLIAFIKATRAEPVMITRPEDANFALSLSQIGLRRIILVRTGNTLTLGPVFSALRFGKLVISEILDIRTTPARLIPASPAGVAKLLI